MERILKFRIWDKEKRSYNHGPSDGLEEYYDIAPVCFFQSLSDCINNKNLIIQQFTGYKDKNNKEIFEGDIVKSDPTHITNVLKADENPIYTKAQIMWLCGGFKVGQGGIGATWLGNFVACHCCPCGLEIIGNVFENPELLELEEVKI